MIYVAFSMPRIRPPPHSTYSTEVSGEEIVPKPRSHSNIDEDTLRDDLRFRRVSSLPLGKVNTRRVSRAFIAMVPCAYMHPRHEAFFHWFTQKCASHLCCPPVYIQTDAPSHTVGCIRTVLRDAVPIRFGSSTGRISSLPCTSACQRFTECICKIISRVGRSSEPM